MKKYLFGIIAVAGIAGLMICPTEAVSAGKEALGMCFSSIIPALLPFFVFSSLFVGFGFAEITGKALGRVMRPVFNVSGAAASAFILGIVSGFPVGAKTAIDLYRRGLCSKAETERTLAFCNNAGPAFVLGTVGVGIWSSTRVGWLLWSAQTAAAVITGIFFGLFWKGSDEFCPPSEAKRERVVRFLPTLVNAVRDSAVSLVYISAFIVFFAIVIAMLSSFGIIPAAASFLAKIPFPLNSSDWEHLLSGIVEFTSGIKMIGAEEPFRRSLTLTSAVLGWAGLSVHCQVLSYISDAGISAKAYIVGKFMQSGLSAAITYGLSFVVSVPTSAKAFAAFAQTPTSVAGTPLFPAFSGLVAIASLLLFLAFSATVQNGK